MLPDICFRLGENEAASTIGDAGLKGGVSSTAEVTSGGISYNGKLSSGRCAGKPVLSAMAKAATKFTVGFQDEKGAPVDLTNTERVVFVVREMTYTNPKYIDKECVIQDPATGGLVELSLTKNDTPYPGLWEAAFQLQGANNALQAEFRIYLELLKGIDYERNSQVDPMTIGEVRMALFDRCPDDNPLLDDLEFKDTEIAYAMRRVVDMWNEEKPVIRGYTFSVVTFPYRYHGVNAVCGELYKMRGMQLLRNSIPFSTGSGQIDDNRRAEPYIKLGSDMINEYRNWMRTEKSRINAENVYGGTGRPAYRPIYGNPRMR